MDFGQLGLFRLAARRLDWLSQRQEVLARNVANADTPGYQPNDLVPFETQLARAGVARLAPRRTDPGHLEGRGRAGEMQVGPMRDTFEVAPSGNEVSLEQQFVRLTETALDHQMATSLYRKHLGMIRMAVSRGR